MFYLCFLIWVCFNLGYAQQSYDSSDCSLDNINPGTKYTCNSFNNSCQTFIVYRSSKSFQTISDISNLFRINPIDLLPLNNLTSDSEILQLEREVIVPINCSCAGQFFQSNFTYLVPENTTYTKIACGVFEGLVKSIVLFEENLSQEGTNPEVGSVVRVPLKCACPDNFTYNTNGVKYLVTYPFVEGDGTIKLGKKFGIPPVSIWEANNFQVKPTVHPNTTFLVPLKSKPVINFDLPSTSPPPPSTTGFLPTNPIEKPVKNTKLSTIYVAGSVVGFCVLLIALVGCGLYVKGLRKLKVRGSLSPFSTPQVSSPMSGPTTRSSTNNSCLSPDLLVGIKYSLSSYSIDELKRATNDFSEGTKIGESLHKALIDHNIAVMIKQMRFEDTREAIDLHSKINHVNIVKLLGVCYGECDSSWSYLVFEIPPNGCLRDCLDNLSSPLQWLKRTQIAFDIATGLHYLHYCMVPPYTHMSISSRSIFITPKWRSKLAVFGNSKENSDIVSVERWVAPERILSGLTTEKIDIFAFGVVLLELISGREDMDGNSFRESIGFLGGGGASEGGCFEQLRNFMDPCLKEDYPLAEALCLAVLAKACVEDDPMHRPSMDDIMKVLARMV